MALVHRLLLPVLILLIALHPGAAKYATQQVQEAVDSLADSLAAWQKDGLEPLGEPRADVEAHGLLKSLPVPVLKRKRNPTMLPMSGEKRNGKADRSPQVDSKHTEVAGHTTKKVPNPHDHIESIFCHGAGCMIGIVIVLVAVPAGILLCSLAVCWWCDRKRRLSGDRQERTSLITRAHSQTSSPEPDPPL